MDSRASTPESMGKTPLDGSNGALPHASIQPDTLSWWRRRIALGRGPNAPSVSVAGALAAAVLFVYAATMTGLYFAGRPLSSSTTTSSSFSAEAKGAISAAHDKDDLLLLWPRPLSVSGPETIVRNVSVGTGPFAVVVALPRSASSEKNAYGGGPLTGRDLVPGMVARYLPLLFPCTPPSTVLQWTVDTAVNAMDDDDDDTKPIALPDPALAAHQTTVVIWIAHPDHGEPSVETNEAYALRVSEPKNNNNNNNNNKVRIDLRAATVFGAMRGLDTLSQLLRPVDATAHLASVQFQGDISKSAKEACTCAGYVVQAAPLLIRDAPRVPHRGLLLDTSRHYFPEETIRSVVDGIAAAKLNVLHWHMVDAQSFPFSTQETRDLAAGGAYSPHHVYDEAAIARIVAYARARGVRVVPEFDLPGHTFSWRAGSSSSSGEETVVCADMHPYQPYGASPPTGQLHPTSSADVVKRVVAAAVRVFPDAYLHLGHDEINGKCWQAFNGGDTARTLVQFHDAVLRPALASAAPLDGRKEKKKKIMIWEEPIVEYDLDRANATRGLFDVVQLWRTGAPEVVRRVQAAGMQVVISDANSWYLDCGFGGWLTDGSPEDLGWCKMRPWQAIYAADPFTPLNLPPPVTSLASATLDISPTAVLGGEVAMWAEMTDQENVASKVFPRALAFAERAWSPSDSTSSISAHTVRRLSDARIRLLVVRGVAAGPVQPAWCAGREDHCAFI